MENNKIDVERIINELRAEADLLNMNDIEDFDDLTALGFIETQKGEPFDVNELFNEMELANRSFVINHDVTIEGKFRFIKKIVRKMTFFIIKHLANSMTDYNIHIVRSMNQIRNYIIGQYKTDKDIENLKVTVSGEVCPQIEIQSKRIREISNENVELKKQLTEYIKQEEKNRLAMEKTTAEIELLKIKMETMAGKNDLISNRIG